MQELQDALGLRHVEFAEPVRLRPDTEPRVELPRHTGISGR
jgi:hypothetical protein